MRKIIPIKFKATGKTYFFDPLQFDIKKGDRVIVETSRGVEIGTAVSGIREIDEAEMHTTLKGVTRPANERDLARDSENKRRQEEAFEICRKKIEAHKLDMKLVEVEYTFDGSKILFYFTADGRVDFRELVKDLANVFRTRIELRQIGVRDEAKSMGSIGVCGRSLCCSAWLDDFVSVSIKMAKEQGLSLNPSKISGACGRLMCCLKYEQDTYEELMRRMPRTEQKVKTPDGAGTVVSVNLLKGTVSVETEQGTEKVIKEYPVGEVKAVKPRKREKGAPQERG
ncbi:MAG TPA: stage 0 sporulation family protein [Candidatus Ornithomonoglobus intestinigallinarum]|uniref:Stage 0 sporulation family protein n=1 Tax=Candidatus Ornithomonoglobus intestinigallinarum TaxID=2840894 RepID=A0A9D1H1B3_9FIRM|nr:stage 0 sporulation family protein [Candidatus Ornithomonoglobus intestinigallinarum]